MDKYLVLDELSNVHESPGSYDNYTANLGWLKVEYRLEIDMVRYDLQIAVWIVGVHWDVGCISGANVVPFHRQLIRMAHDTKLKAMEQKCAYIKRTLNGED